MVSRLEDEDHRGGDEGPRQGSNSNFIPASDPAEAGIPKERVAVDPGLGFGKTLEHNLELIHHIDAFQDLAAAVAIGASRKSFIGRLSGVDEAADRMAGSISAVLAARSRGVQIFRVHDVAETRQALEVWEATVGTRT